jgi:hypothetical protein
MQGSWRDPKVKERFADLGGTAIGGSFADFGTLIADEIAKMGQSDSSRQYQSGLIRDVGTARSLSRVELAPVKRGSAKHRSIRRRQSQRAPGIREQPRP